MQLFWSKQLQCFPRVAIEVIDLGEYLQEVYVKRLRSVDLELKRDVLSRLKKTQLIPFEVQLRL